MKVLKKARKDKDNQKKIYKRKCNNKKGSILTFETNTFFVKKKVR